MSAFIYFISFSTYFGALFGYALGLGAFVLNRLINLNEIFNPPLYKLYERFCFHKFLKIRDIFGRNRLHNKYIDFSNFKLPIMIFNLRLFRRTNFRGLTEGSLYVENERSEKVFEFSVDFIKKGL